MCTDELAKTCFKVLKLDTRASKKEVELAYEVLTKNPSNPSMIKDYRFAFEYLMCSVFSDTNSSNTNEIEDINNKITKSIHENMPEIVKDCLNSVEGWTQMDLNERTQALFANQKVNLPMFLKAILEPKNHIKIFGIRLWTKNNIKDIILEACLNPLEYVDFTFDLFDTACYVQNSKMKTLLSVLKDYKKVLNLDYTLCKKFKFKRNGATITGHVIAEVNTAKDIYLYLLKKAKDFSMDISVIGDSNFLQQI